ncbi:hypothetical protein WISP_54826 [Willisornis vidua]|uniref:PAS domain-containing protein n=1 Tax=Willisornis vidua TaxID=1566151 RepID=A0ABQ9DCG9_9PASS|nr:hypothetical protein WISP_54826 [Willisornis vidua]
MLRWAVHLEGGPRRVNHAAVAVGHKVYSFGGYCSGEDYETLRQIDVHVFNAVSLRWIKLPPVWTNSRDHVREVPYMRYGHSAVLIDDTVYIWGGRNDTEGTCNVLYAFDVNTHKWFTPKVSGMVPGARDGHSACVLAKSMFIFGGYEQLGTPARWRDFHSATMIGTKMYVFGGRADRFGPFHSNNEIYCNRIKVFDTETNSWLDSPSTPVLPEGRRSHSAFSYNGELYVFGGYNARLNRHFHDLWKFNPVSLSWRKIEPKGKGPCPRRRQCCCRVGDKIILFGGTRLIPNTGMFVNTSVSPSPEEGMGDEFDLMDHSDLYILDFSPSLKTLCKLAVIQYSLDQSCLPHDIRSTKSASKARRDQINAELQALRSLLPISIEEKERLSYLHTMALVELLAQGDTVFDILDGRACEDVYKKLLLAWEEPGREVTFVSEMCTSKAFRLQHGGNRVVTVCGRFVTLSWPPSPSTTAFLALCTPVMQSPADGKAGSQDDIFQSTHILDMTFIDVTESVTYHLGYRREELVGQSWYSLLHPEDADLAAAQHRAVAFEAGAGPAAGAAVLRVLRRDRAWAWLRVWARRDGGGRCITCTCRCLREEEAAHLRAKQRRATAPPAGPELGRVAAQLRALADSLSPPAAAPPGPPPRPLPEEADASDYLGNSLLDSPQFLCFPFELERGQKIG